MWTVTEKEDQNLLIVRSDAVFDYSTLRDFLSKVYVEDKGRLASYDRFADLSAIKLVDVHIDTVVEVVQSHRRLNPPSNEVKAAVLLPSGLASSLAHIFKAATENDSLINIQVFNSIEDCAEYLKVDQSILNHSAS